jgi:predicted transcriptional regulator
MRRVFTMTFCLPDKQRAAIKRSAKKRNMTVSEVLREAIDDYLAKVAPASGK